MEDPNDGVVNELDGDGKPVIRVWHKPGKVFFALDNSPMMEMEDGRLSPGMGFCPHSAIEVAHAIIGSALKAIEEYDDSEHNSEEGERGIEG